MKVLFKDPNNAGRRKFYCNDPLANPNGYWKVKHTLTHFYIQVENLIQRC